MDQIFRLRQQAEKAERLARSGFDPITCERLLAASREYRQQAIEIEATVQPTAH